MGAGNILVRVAQSARAELITQTPLNFMTFFKIYPTKLRVALSSSRVLIFHSNKILRGVTSLLLQ